MSSKTNGGHWLRFGSAMQAETSRGVSSDASDDVATFLRVCGATVYALEKVMQVRYQPMAYPNLWHEPHQYFMVHCRGSASCYNVQIRVMTDHMCVSCYFPLSIPSSRRGRTAKYIAQVSSMIVLGQFELDFNDGELRFRIVQDVSSSLAPCQIVRFFEASRSMMDQHFPVFMRLACGGMARSRQP